MRLTYCNYRLHHLMSQLYLCILYIFNELYKYNFVLFSLNSLNIYLLSKVLFLQINIFHGFLTYLFFVKYLKYFNHKKRRNRILFKITISSLINTFTLQRSYVSYPLHLIRIIKTQHPVHYFHCFLGFLFVTDYDGLCVR